MEKRYKYLFALFISIIPLVIYLYFLKCRTYTIYGDDLYAFDGLLHAKNYSEVIGLSLTTGKYRPVASVATEVIFKLFQKHLIYYYIFNVVIQSINCYLVALLLNLFLKSPMMSLFFSLIYGLARFSFFVTSQLFNGGALEGLAITFLLLSLFFILKALIKYDQSGRQIQTSFLWSILFANLSMYTHERYIVLFPFIILVIIFFPGLKVLTGKQKIIPGIIALVSILLNVAIKKYVYSIPFFVGTGGTNISFSFSSAISFFSEAILSIFQINIGNLSHFGYLFTSLSLLLKIIILLFASSLGLILLLYLINAKNAFILKDNDQKRKFFIFLFLSVLFVFCLIPAVVTIRLEERWLQAPFCIFIIMIALALTSLPFKNTRTKNIAFILITICFLWSNDRYFYKGIPNLYITYAQNDAITFKKAIEDNTIYANTEVIYIFEKHINDGLKWSLGSGYFFEFYQKKSKKLVFVDSAYLHTPGAYANFGKDSAQVISLKDNVVTDLTGEFLKDSLKNLN